MRDRAFRCLAAAVFAVCAPSIRAAEREPSSAGTSSVCADLKALDVDKQANPRAGRLSVACREGESPSDAFRAPVTRSPRRATGPATSLIGGSDLNLITGDETFPDVTQAGSMVWGNGTTVVAVYNDTRNAPGSFSGMSVSIDGGVNFTRLDPNPFDAVFATDSGSPAVAYDASAGLWLATTIASDCGTQSIGLMTSDDPSDPASWTIATCPHSGTADDRPILWVDNNAASPFYGRRYIAFNDFSTSPSGKLKVVYFASNAWTEVIVANTFIRNVHITGSPGTDGRVFIFGMDEGGGAGNSRANKVYRSENGGVGWSTFSPGPSFQPAGAGLCRASDYFYMVPPVWRHMGWGQGAVGPGGVVHYVFSGAGQVPGDLGDIFYIRSTDNGASWTAPTPLNQDQAAQNNVVQWQPSISVTSGGRVLATWYDRRETTDGLNYKYYGRQSLDNGASFLAGTAAPEEPISDLNLPQPTQVDASLSFCFAGDSNFHGTLGNDSLATWTDGRNAISDGSKDVSQMDVYFDRVALCPKITVSPAVLPDGTVNASYSQGASFDASGGTGPYAFALAGTLPDGLTLNGNVITGIPTTAGITPFAIVATDTLGCTGSQTYNLIIEPAGCPAISISPATIPNTTQGAPYTATLTASGGSAPYTFSVTAGALPTGLTLDDPTPDDQVEIAGTAEESGSPSFAITATDANQCTGTRTYAPTIACPVITLSPENSQLPDAYVGVPYLTNITANGGTAPYTYEITQGTITQGLFTTSGGTVYGVTEGPGSKQPQWVATDANGCTTDPTQFRIDSVNCFPGDKLWPSGGCDATADLATNFTITDQCGGGGAEWYGSQACPSSGDIGHSPSAHARWGTNAVCTNYGSVFTQDSLTSASLDVSSCNSGEVILDFNYLLSFEDDNDKDRARVEVVADGGASVVVADNGGLVGPTCSGLANTGIGNLTTWSGWQHLQLTLPATSTFQVSFIGETDDGTNNDGEGFFVDDVFVKCKCPDDLALSPEVLPNAIADTAYSQTIVMSGGQPPYTYTTLPGHPTPPGLSLDPTTGVLSGTPTTPGIYEFSIVGTDSNFCKLIVLYRLIVSPQGCPAIMLTPDFLASGAVNTFYSGVVTASGGTGPYLYLVTVGDLPPGLAIDPDTGVISGTPTTPGIYQFTISAVDDNFCVGSQDYTIIINPEDCPAIDIQPDVLPNADSGVFYSQTLTATGGEAPYTWVVAGGALPGGLTLDPDTGTISGAAFETSAFSFLVAAQDTNGCFGSRSYGFDVIETGSLSYFTLTPCRIFDTRSADGPLGGPILTAGVPRTFTIGGVCGIPLAAKAVAVNLTAVGATGNGNLRMYPAGTAEPNVSTLNYVPGVNRGNNAIVPVNLGQVVVLARPSGSVHAILDVTGYFQ